MTCTPLSIIIDYPDTAFLCLARSDLFFALGKLGYLGISTLRCTEAISSTKFHRKKEQELSWFKRNAHILGVFGVLAAMLGSFCYLFGAQLTGAYTVGTIFVEFGDETVPSLGLFNGCYKKDESSKTWFGRLQFESTAQGGTFAYCSALGRWTFFDSDFEDECNDFLVKSEETTTFDVLESGKI